MPCDVCPIRNDVLYCDASEEDFGRIIACRKDKFRLKKGHLIAAGPKSDSYVYSLVEGWAYSFVLLRDGRRQILDLFFEGDLVSMPGLGGAGLHAGVRCLTNVTVCQFDKKQFFAAFAKSPTLSASLTTHFEVQRTKFEKRLLELGVLTAEEAVASLIFSVLGRLRDHGQNGATIKFPLRLNEIAESVGITSIHAGRVMRDLEKRQVILRRPGGKLYVDEDRLARILSAHGDGPR